MQGESRTAEVAVIGGGVVGAAIGYGLARRGVRVLVIDGADRDFRAANANFGLVWLQGKGLGMPAYQALTGEAVAQWPGFCAELQDLTGVDLEYDQRGGLVLCLGEAELAQRRGLLAALDDQRGDGARAWEMLDRQALAALFGRAAPGPEVTGASFGRRDGQCNPLRLLAALHAGLVRTGGALRGGCPVQSLRGEPGGGFRLGLADGAEVSCARVVIAAGLGTAALATQVGLAAPIRPQRGQLLVTERLEPILPLPSSGLRQTRGGTVMIGATQDEPGLDASTTVAAAAALSARAIRRLPALREVKLVRQWAGLRILTPDAHPIYAQSESHPGAFLAVCHSGVTLAAAHAGAFAAAVAAGALPPALDPFHPRRFDVPQAA